MNNPIEGKGKSESAIKSDIMAFLATLPSACFMTRLSGTYRGLSGGRTIRAGKDGAADIIGCYLGVPVAIETKKALGLKGGIKGATQRASQIAFEIQWQNAGGLYLIARSVDDVSKALLDLWRNKEK